MTRTFLIAFSASLALACAKPELNTTTVASSSSPASAAPVATETVELPPANAPLAATAIRTDTVVVGKPAAVHAEVHERVTIPANAPPPVPSGLTTSAKLKSIDLAQTVDDPAKYKDEDISQTYQKARLVADRLDKMYCYCRCAENEGLKHKSLLTCFQSDHAAECGICLNEAKQAWMDWKDGLPLEVTTKAVDLMYNQGNTPPTVLPHAH